MGSVRGDEWRDDLFESVRRIGAGRGCVARVGIQYRERAAARARAFVRCELLLEQIMPGTRSMSG